MSSGLPELRDLVITVAIKCFYPNAAGATRGSMFVAACLKAGPATSFIVIVVWSAWATRAAWAAMSVLAALMADLVGGMPPVKHASQAGESFFLFKRSMRRRTDRPVTAGPLNLRLRLRYIYLHEASSRYKCACAHMCVRVHVCLVGVWLYRCASASACVWGSLRLRLRLLGGVRACECMFVCARVSACWQCDTTCPKPLSHIAREVCCAGA